VKIPEWAEKAMTAIREYLKDDWYATKVRYQATKYDLGVWWTRRKDAIRKYLSDKKSNLKLWWTKKKGAVKIYFENKKLKLKKWCEERKRKKMQLWKRQVIAIFVIVVGFAAIIVLSDWHFPQLPYGKVLPWIGVATGIALLALAIRAYIKRDRKITKDEPIVEAKSDKNQNERVVYKPSPKASGKSNGLPWLLAGVFGAIIFVPMIGRQGSTPTTGSIPVAPVSYTPELGVQPMKLSPKFSWHYGDSIPEEDAKLIGEKFAQFGDSVVILMKDICYAESSGCHQFDPADSLHVFQGRENPRDLGMMQVNDSLHGPMCRKAGYDITTAEGNVDCAVLVYKLQSENAWSNSAWQWRDHFISKPEHWRWDRMPEQLLASANDEDEIIPVIAPVTSEGDSVTAKSSPVYSDGRCICWDVRDAGVRYEMENDRGEILRPLPGSHGASFPSYPRWVVVRSLGSEPVEFIFRRTSHGCK
jgi:hypothetical protein